MIPRLVIAGEPFPAPTTWDRLPEALSACFTRQGDQWTGEIEIVMALRSADGKDRGTTRQPVALKLTQAQYDMVSKQGMSVSKTLEPTGDVAEIRAVVADRISGRVGSLIMPVK